MRPADWQTEDGSIRLSLVQWQRLFPGIEVVYSSLAQPHNCTDLDDDVAALRLANGYGVDVAWDNGSNQFTLRLYFQSYHTAIMETTARTTNEVVTQVGDWYRDFATQTTSFASAGGLRS